ncbi:MAG: hypothetical protein ACM3VZ_06680 [Acidobacteriota bacterium]
MGKLSTIDQSLADAVSELSRRLVQAMHHQDWSALHVIDNDLSALLTRMPPAERWSPELAHAMTVLRHTHSEALMMCAMASEDMAARMSAALNRKEGWLAYAANSDWMEKTP